VVGGDEWLTVAEAVQKLRDAGYPESHQTVRRLADAGHLMSYRTEAGAHRRIRAESVDALIRARRGEPTDGPAPPG
jgi:excisionase family DNA binding protein